MMLAMQILIVLGVLMVGYAIFGIFYPDLLKNIINKKNSDKPFVKPGLENVLGVQQLQSKITQLENELLQVKVEYSKEKSESTQVEEKETKFLEGLKRREDLVTRAEAEVYKIRPENTELKNKLAAKEKELQDEFTKNVNLSREIRETKASLEAKEAEAKLKEEQLQIQKHQIEKQLKDIGESSAAITEFNRKENISEWVPKAEFSQLQEKYAELEKDLEEKEKRIKSFAVEIAHLKSVTPPENKEGERRI